MIWIVCGPPAGGKTSYVTEHKTPGDVVVDFDVLAQALGSTVAHGAPGPIGQVAFAARKAAIARVFEGIDTDAWIIQGNPARPSVERWGAAGARFVLVDPGEDEAIARAEADGRPEATIEQIRAWYADPPQIPQAWLETPKKGKMAMRIKSAPAEIKAGDLEEGEFIAYASTFDREPDAYGDVVAPGAFDATLKEWADSGNTVPVLFGHRMDDPDFFIGGVVSAEVDERGLKVRGKLDLEQPKAAQVYRLIKGRRLTQLSFAFDVLDAATVELDDGRKANELRAVKLYEISLVPIGANQNTEVLAVKAAADVLAASAQTGRVLSEVNADRLAGVLATLDEAAAKIKSCLADTGQVVSEVAGAIGTDPRPTALKERPAKDPNPPASGLDLLIAMTMAGI